MMDSLRRFLSGSNDGSDKKEEHRIEVRKRRISKLENMREAAVMDEDDDLYEYADSRLKTLKRLDQEAELIRMGKKPRGSNDRV